MFEQKQKEKSTCIYGSVQSKKVPNKLSKLGLLY